jgi:hypothetical protein
MGRHLKGLACQAHHITNETVDIFGDVAHVEAYLIAFRRNQNDSSAFIIGGRYIDRFDRRAGEWRIAVREFIPHFTIEGPSHLSHLAWPQSGQGVGTCDKGDPSYLRPLNSRPNNDTEMFLTSHRHAIEMSPYQEEMRDGVRRAALPRSSLSLAAISVFQPV